MRCRVQAPFEANAVSSVLCAVSRRKKTMSDERWAVSSRAALRVRLCRLMCGRSLNFRKSPVFPGAPLKFGTRLGLSLERFMNIEGTAPKIFLESYEGQNLPHIRRHSRKRVVR